MSFPLLTDEQITKIANAALDDCMGNKKKSLTFAISRAVESATRAPLLAEIERLTAELAAARAALEVAKSADGMREPKNGTDWNVQWWNESARVMLPSGSRIDNVNSFRNGTLILTIKRAARGEKAQSDTLRALIPPNA